MISTQQKKQQQPCAITNSTQGIGESIVNILLKNNASKVVAVARSQEALEALQSTHGQERFQFIAGDVTDPETSKKAVELAISKFGQLNSVIANAGVLDPVGLLDQTSIDGWKKLYDINLFSVVQLLQVALPELRKTKGNVVAVSSGAATTAYSGWSAYGSSKAALNHLIFSLASDEAEVLGIQAISVAPGVVATSMQKDIREKFGTNMTRDALQRFVDLHENSQLAHPDEPGTVLANLALKGWLKELNGKFIRYNDDVMKDYQ